jgi:predicted DNA-binding transcriptional regulator AlpA
MPSDSFGSGITGAVTAAGVGFQPYFGPDEIEDVTGMSLDEIHAGITAKTFPCSREVEPGASGWVERDIEEWERAKQKGVRWRPAKVPRPTLHGDTELYRHFDQAGRLLYVGVSLRSTVRLMAHMNRAQWADLIAIITIERFPTREAAMRAERAAIQAEKPAHNIAHAKC